MTGNDLKQWRERVGMSQRALARKLDVHVMTVSAWERGFQAMPPYLHLALLGLEHHQTEAKKPKSKLRIAS